jgi:Cu(I)/Ag(I) efflux system membrane protein CusA/SilA
VDPAKAAATGNPLAPRGITCWFRTKRCKQAFQNDPAGFADRHQGVDTSRKHSLADLRSYQDSYLRYYLRSLPGVAEVPPIGGYTSQFQVNTDPNLLQAYGIPVSCVVEAVRGGNNESSGRLLEFGGRVYMVRGRGYTRSPEDFENIPLGVSDTGSQIRVKDVGRVVMRHSTAR